MLKNYFKRMKVKGVCPPRVPLKQILWSGLGSFFGIFLIGLVGHYFQFSEIQYTFLIGSFGASAVLVYGAPLAPLSQPRNLIGGHVVSALVGVTIYVLLGSSPLASAIAVSVSIMMMHLTRTLHPPGGASALIAVIGGEKIHALGYLYVVMPVFVGALILLIIALKINNLSTNINRHYPVYWY